MHRNFISLDIGGRYAIPLVNRKPFVMYVELFVFSLMAVLLNTQRSILYQATIECINNLHLLKTSNTPSTKMGS